MPPRGDPEWRLRIEDILRTIERIRSYTEGLSLELFRTDPKAADAVLYNLVILGEAARFVPDEVARRYPDVDWPRMRGMRNVLVHEYFGARLETVWQTIQQDLPGLLPPLRAILEKES